jgi:hypothetical protein
MTTDRLKLAVLEPGTTAVVRNSALAKADLHRPMVGFMVRNHLGVDVAGTNTARERTDLAPMRGGDVVTVDFYVELPVLYAGTFSFSPAIANGTLDHYSTCDWIDNAMVLQMEYAQDAIYGQQHLPCRVAVNARVGAGIEVR